MPSTPEAIKSTADAAGHAGENRDAFIGVDGLEMDSITRLSPPVLAES